ncbi:MAG: NAD-dependent dihydropyrimidine dehydrogenase subunit PreA [Dehalobacterium sp.]
MSKKNIGIEFCGFKCINPFFLAASPVARSGEMISRAFEMGWGGAVTKSVSLEQDLPDHSLSPRFSGARAGGNPVKLQKNTIGLGNMDFRIDKSVQETMDSFAAVKVKYPDRMLVLSIKAPFVEEAWCKLSKLAAATGADAIEACLSCPDGAGGSIGQNPDSVKEVLGWLKSSVSTPIVVKATAHVNNLGLIAMAAQEGGAAAVSAINTLKSMGGINLRTENPIPTVKGMSTSVGLSGAAIKSVAQYCIYEIAKTPGINIQLSGVGGVTCAHDAIEYILFGASTIQAATQIMFEGYGFVQDMKDGLERFMVEHSYACVQDLVGSALDKLVPATGFISREQQLKANIDQELCINCGRCYVSCRDGGYQAISFSCERKAEVNKDDCVGCGLCRLTCPVPGAVYYSDDEGRKDGLN